MFKLYEVLILACFNDKRVWHQIEIPSNILLARASVQNQTVTTLKEDTLTYKYIIYEISPQLMCAWEIAVFESSLPIFARVSEVYTKKYTEAYNKLKHP